MEQSAIEAIRIRNIFYRDSYKRSLLAILASLLVTFLLVGVFIYQQKSVPEPVYFATNQDGSLKVMIPLELPYVTDAFIEDFVTKTVLWSFSYDFLNYRNSLQQVRTRYTPEGYQNFIDALTKSENLQTVLEKKFAVTAQFVNPPVITQQGVLPSNNTYAWRVQMPINLLYVSSQEQKIQPVVATVVITRVSSLLSENGIATASLILQDRTP